MSTDGHSYSATRECIGLVVAWYSARTGDPKVPVRTRARLLNEQMDCIVDLRALDDMTDQEIDATFERYAARYKELRKSEDGA